MPDPTAIVAEPITEPVSTEPAPASTGLLDADYNFTGNWKEQLLDDDIRGEKFFDSDYAKNAKTLLKKSYHQEKTIGQYKAGFKGVKIPDEKATQEEIDTFRDATGVPKEYAYSKPDDVDEDVVTSEFMTSTMERLNKANVSQKQFDEVMDIFANRIREIEAAGVEELNGKTKTAIERVQKEDPKGIRRELATKFITKMTDVWPAEKYQELFGTENESGERAGGINVPEFAYLRPLLLDMFATIEETYAIPTSAALSDTTESKSASIEDELKTLESTPGFLEGRLRTSSNPDDRAKHFEIMKKRSDLIRRQTELQSNVQR